MSGEAENQQLIRLEGIQKEYKIDGAPFYALKNISLSFPSRGLVAVLGPSGCGKTTLLNLIGGLDHPTSGDFLFDGKSTSSFTEKQWDVYRNSRIGFVFQSYNLVNYRNVIQNVELPLELAGIARKERESLSRSALKKVGLEGLEKKKTNQLSGGQAQRVAIARAIVNHPSIVLADEPTGALDSSSSKMILDVLKDISLDCLVVFVTHNEELASNYADRIIRMKDGEVSSDELMDNPPAVANASSNALSPKKHSRLSPFSVLRSCLGNIAHKKTRTILTSVSCSFGILGIALILAINNGFSSYVDKVERSVANSVPISLSPVTVKTHYESTELPPEYPEEKEVYVYDSRKNFSETIYNNFSDEYFSYLNAIMDDPSCEAYGSAMSVMFYRKSLSYHFLKEVGDDVLQINQFTNARSSTYTLSSSTAAPSTILHELYGDEKNMSSLYDTVAGKFPTEANELALVLDSYNRIDFSTMKALGFYSSDDVLDDDNKTFTFDEMLGSVFKCYTHAGYYGVSSAEEFDEKIVDFNVEGYSKLSVSITDGDGDGTYEASVKDEAPDQHVKTCKVFDPPSPKEVYSDDATHKPIVCKIVGILRPTKGSYIQLMPSSIAYTPALSKIMAAQQNEGVSQRLAEYQKNNWVIPYKTKSNSWGFDGKESLQNAFDYLAKAITKIKAGGSFDDASAELSNFKTFLNSSFCYLNVNGYNGSTCSYTSSASSFLSRCKNYGAEFGEIDFKSIVLETALSEFPNLGTDFFDGSGETSIVDWIASLNSYALVDSILIFPASLSSKTTITKYLDAWNSSHPEAQNEYLDVMSDFTSQIGVLVGLISAVLIVLTSISLLVSSIMTAIITYVSVVERTKEIGILRSCGAKKFDITRIFESESIFVGIVAGGLGILLTWLACIPVNKVLNQLFPSNNLGEIAKINPWHALLLIAISALLAFLSGLIPSQIAARKDPVVCLRNE